MEVDIQPLIEMKITVNVPRAITLPVRTDEAGYIVPATGFVHQKYLNFDTLEAIGCSIEWVDSHGVPIQREQVMALIEQAKAREALAQAQAAPVSVLQA